MHCLRGDDAEVAGRDLVRGHGRVQPADDVSRTAQPKPFAVDRVHVLLRQIVGPHLHVIELREIGREQRADRAASDDADPHQAALSRWAAASSSARGDGGETPPPR
jgi:hypothetical protein